MKTPEHGLARPILIGLTLLAFTAAPQAQELRCNGSPVTSGCTVNGVASTCGGTSANEVIEGTDANDVINGGGGNDFINGGFGRDIICGGTGRDLIDGGFQANDLYSQGGNDTLVASPAGWTGGAAMIRSLQEGAPRL